MVFEGKAVSALILTLLLTSMLTVASDIQPVRASGTIYIRADGSIDPSDAPISTVDNVTYTLTGNITSDADGIVVERSDIVIGGDSYTLQGTGSGTGITLSGRSNVTINNTEITTFLNGIWLDSSSNNSISGNNITANNYCGILLTSSSYNSIFGNNITNNYNGIDLYLNCYYNSISGNDITANNGDGIGLDEGSNNYNSISGNNIANNGGGIYLYRSSYNSISGNNITNNWYGIGLFSSSSNSIFHNNFINNDQQVFPSDSVNAWDDGYPSGGNYWSNYTGVDIYSGPNQDQPGSDRIGDTPYPIDTENRDRYPLMYSWGNKGNKIGVRDIVHFDGIDVTDNQANITDDPWGLGVIFGNRCFSIQQNFFLECGNGTIRWVQNVYYAYWNGTPGEGCTLYVSQSAWIWTADPGNNSEFVADVFFGEPWWNLTEAGTTPYVDLELNSYIRGSELIMSGLQAGEAGSELADVGIGARIIEEPADANVLQVPNWNWPNPKNTRPQLVLVGYGDRSEAVWGNLTSGWVDDYETYSLVGGVPQWVQDNAADVVTNNDHSTGETSYNLGWEWNLGQERGIFTYEPFSNETGIASYAADDVAVTNITTSRTVSQGFSASINVTVANRGSYTETFNVTCYANTTIIDTLTGITLASGSSTIVTFIWNTSGFALGNYTISAYAWPVPGETDTLDNTFTDGTVQIVPNNPWSSPTGGGGRPAYVR